MSQMNIYTTIIESLEHGSGGILATVIRRQGPAPREVGTKMFVGRDGKTFGTIGGGRAEAEVRSEALRIMNGEQTMVLSLYTESQRTGNLDLACGGDLEVLLEPVMEKHLDLYGKIEEFRKNRKRGVVVTKFRDGLLAKALIGSDWSTMGDTLGLTAFQLPHDIFYQKKPLFMEDILVEPIRLTFPLYLFGAGHVSQNVSKVANVAEFEVTVIDDREEFANRNNFPDAALIIVGDFRESFNCLDFTGNEYVVIVTRSHELDAAVLEQALQKPVRYMGMIGSRRKVEAIFNNMRKKGFEEKDIEKIHAPIGISIDAETPGEIAVSIVAQLITARNAAHAIPLQGGGRDGEIGSL
jgi:xanthine dehydrogenase accessory factor